MKSMNRTSKANKYNLSAESAQIILNILMTAMGIFDAVMLICMLLYLYK